MHERKMKQPATAAARALAEDGIRQVGGRAAVALVGHRLRQVDTSALGDFEEVTEDRDRALAASVRRNAALAHRLSDR